MPDRDDKQVPLSFRSALLAAVVFAVLPCCLHAATPVMPLAYIIANPDPAGDNYRYQGHTGNLRVVLDLLRNGCSVDWIDSPVVAPMPMPKAVPMRRGDYLVRMSQPKARLARAIISSLPANRRIEVVAPVSIVAYPLSDPKILVDAQRWAGNYYWYYDTLLAGGFQFEHLLKHGDRSLDPARHNLFVVPGGGGAIPKQYNSLLRSYVAAGGNYLGSCWGCAQALYPSKVSYGSGNGAGIADAHNVEKIRSFGALGGVGHIILRNDAPDHPIMWDLPRTIHNIYWNGPVMKPGPQATALASFVDVVTKDFRFQSTRAELQRTDVEEERGKCMYLTSHRAGEGRVTLFGNHPEASDGVNPFAAHKMGHKATYNAILFSTAGRRRPVAITAQPKSTGTLPVKKIIVPIGEARPLRKLAAALKTDVDRRLTQLGNRSHEDDRNGFYLLRLRAALLNLQEIPAAHHVPAHPGREADIGAKVIADDGSHLLSRWRLWRVATAKALSQLRTDLGRVDLRQLRRAGGTAWHSIVAPVYERSLQWTHLKRDLGFRASL